MATYLFSCQNVPNSEFEKDYSYAEFDRIDKNLIGCEICRKCNPTLVISKRIFFIIRKPNKPTRSYGSYSQNYSYDKPHGEFCLLKRIALRNHSNELCIH